MVIPVPGQSAVTIAKPQHSANPGGMLPVSTAGPKPRITNPQGQPPRHQASGLKISIRRLPPSLTEQEFQTALGPEWKAGSPHVDWASYVPGKVSKDPAKPSRPSRAYLHLTDTYLREHLTEPLKQLQIKISTASFVDAKGTHNDPALLMPWPALVESPYGRIPSTKIRKDNRQGTIDQDQEFIDFLQELTNPLVKPTPIDAITEKDSKPEEKIVTPLVQFLREKKANKAKDASSGGKGSKHNRQESKDPKTTGQSGDKKSKASKDSAPEKKASTNKSEKPTKEPVKLLNKHSHSNPKAPAGGTPAAGKHTDKAPSVVSSNTSPANSITAKPERKRERERGSVAAAAKILQRDLGLSGAAHGRRRKDTQNTTVAAPAKEPVAQPSSSTPEASVSAPVNSKAPSTGVTTNTSSSPATVSTDSSKSTGGAKPSQPPTGPRNNQNRNQTKVGSQTNKSASGTLKPTAPTSSTTSVATEAFLKHANSSQGITEPLLQSTFAGFGIVTKVEIDKKKGFAYVDFAEPESLQRAIAASPVKIAQGAVVVLERRMPNAPQSRTSRGDTRGGRGGASTSTTRGGRGRGRGGRQGSDGPAQSVASPQAASAGPPSAAARGSEPQLDPPV